jgi:hypothetical protein
VNEFSILNDAYSLNFRLVYVIMHINIYVRVFLVAFNKIYKKIIISAGPCFIFNYRKFVYLLIPTKNKPCDFLKRERKKERKIHFIVILILIMSSREKELIF